MQCMETGQKKGGGLHPSMMAAIPCGITEEFPDRDLIYSPGQQISGCLDKMKELECEVFPLVCLPHF